MLPPLKALFPPQLILFDRLALVLFQPLLLFVLLPHLLLTCCCCDIFFSIGDEEGGGGKVGGGGDGGGGGGIDDVVCYVGFVKLLRKINLGGGESEKSNGQNM